MLILIFFFMFHKLIAGEHANLVVDEVEGGDGGVFHIRQAHWNPLEMGAINEEERKKLVSKIAKSQLEILNFVQKNPEADYFLEGVGEVINLYGLDRDSYHKFEYLFSSNNIDKFKAGKYLSIDDLNEEQKVFLAKIGGLKLALLLQIINKIFPAERVEANELARQALISYLAECHGREGIDPLDPLLSAVNDINQRRLLNPDQERLLNLMVDERERIAIEMVNKYRNKNHKVYIVFGSSHHFKFQEDKPMKNNVVKIKKKATTEWHYDYN